MDVRAVPTAGPLHPSRDRLRDPGLEPGRSVADREDRCGHRRVPGQRHRGVSRPGGGLARRPRGALRVRSERDAPPGEPHGRLDFRLFVLRELHFVLERPATATFEVGAWRGAPRLVQPRAPPLLTPQPICVNFDSVTGLNWTSLTTEIDGQVVPHDPWTPNARGICVDASAIPDGNHTLRATAWDMVGQRMDDTFPFETDGTPPSVALTSPSLTATLPYNMTGTVNDSHPNIVDVNGNLATVSGATWFSVVSQMHIGGNAIPVTATDTLDNVRSTTFPIRYWPAHTNNVTNTTEHFFVFSPPGWTTSSQALGGGLYATNLIGPTESPLPPLVSIVATRDVNASQGSSYALAAAQAAASYTASIGGVILTPVHAVTLGGHPAAP